MKVYAVSDLHLPGSLDKSMDMFGPAWQGHWDKIRQDWLARVQQEDVVLLCGDISWAMQFADALPDLRSIAALPGHKVMIRGNHDFWWSSVTRVREAAGESFSVLQNDAVRIGNYVFAGTRGWAEEDGADNKKIFARELLRLEMALQCAAKLSDDSTSLCVLLHYPPVTKAGKSAFCSLLEHYGARWCVYGHLHGVCPPEEIQPFSLDGITYVISSCDRIGFSLREIGGNENGKDL